MDPLWHKAVASMIAEEKLSDNTNNYAPKTNDSFCYCAPTTTELTITSKLLQ